MEIIRKYWAIILFCFAISGAAANAQMTIADQGRRLEKLETTPVAIARIESTQDAMKAQLNRIENKLDK